MGEEHGKSYDEPLSAYQKRRSRHLNAAILFLFAGSLLVVLAAISPHAVWQSTDGPIFLILLGAMMFGLGTCLLGSRLKENRFGIRHDGFYPSSRTLGDGLRGERVFIAFGDVKYDRLPKDWVLRSRGLLDIVTSRGTYRTFFRDIGVEHFNGLLQALDEHLKPRCKSCGARTDKEDPICGVCGSTAGTDDRRLGRKIVDILEES